MRVSAIIEARMGSSRLHGKAMLPAAGLPLLGHVIKRAAASQIVDTVVVATPDTPENQPIWDFCSTIEQLKVVKGDETDVLSRVLKAGLETETDIIVELTGDCPLIDPWVIDLCAGYFICGQNPPPGVASWDAVVNTHPRTWPRGMEVRVFSTETLARVDAAVRGDPREPYWREHVSPWLYETPGWSVLNLEADDRETCPELNLSVDTADDYKRAKDLIEALDTGNPNFPVRSAMEYLASLPGYDMLRNPSKQYIEPAWFSNPKDAESWLSP